MMKKRWIFILGLALMTSCGKEIPEDIIQPEQMEKVLYDYHLSMGMHSNLKSSENYQKDAYKNYVFKKHRITEALFDSSMVWYTRHSMELASIYENLDKRFKREHAQSNLMLEGRDGESTRITIEGDSVNIWSNKGIFWLTDAPLNNLLTFDFKADSNFHPKDAFFWKADIVFLSKGKASIGFNVVYENDSVIGETRQITQSGPQTFYLHTDSAYQIKELNGFIHIEKDSLQKPNALVHNVSLMRFHTTSSDSLEVDSNAKDLEMKLDKPSDKQ